METLSPQQVEARVEARHKVFLILWFAILVSVMLLLVLVLVAGSNGVANPTLSYALLGVGAMTVAVSFLLKQQGVQKAINNNDIAALQSAQIISLALCESAALMGVLDRFVTASSTGWLLFAIAAIGIFLHFPKKEHIQAVSYKQF
jgi:predicted MFS family arabinose efflux permease